MWFSRKTRKQNLGFEWNDSGDEDSCVSFKLSLDDYLPSFMAFIKKEKLHLVKFAQIKEWLKLHFCDTIIHKKCYSGTANFKNIYLVDFIL